MKKHEQEKKESYTSIIMNVKHWAFMPFVFALTGGEDLKTSICYVPHAYCSENCKYSRGKTWKSLKID